MFENPSKSLILQQCVNLNFRAQNHQKIYKCIFGDFGALENICCALLVFLTRFFSNVKWRQEKLFIWSKMWRKVWWLREFCQSIIFVLNTYTCYCSFWAEHEVSSCCRREGGGNAQKCQFLQSHTYSISHAGLRHNGLSSGTKNESRVDHFIR